MNYPVISNLNNMRRSFLNTKQQDDKLFGVLSPIENFCCCTVKTTYMIVAILTLIGGFFKMLEAAHPHIGVGVAFFKVLLGIAFIILGYIGYKGRQEKYYANIFLFYSKIAYVYHIVVGVIILIILLIVDDIFASPIAQEFHLEKYDINKEDASKFFSIILIIYLIYFIIITIIQTYFLLAIHSFYVKTYLYTEDFEVDQSMMTIQDPVPLQNFQALPQQQSHIYPNQFQLQQQPMVVQQQQQPMMPIGQPIQPIQYQLNQHQ